MSSNNVLFKIIFRLEYDGIDNFPVTSGPTFNKWLPNGKQNSIIMNTGLAFVSLKIWFNRRGITNSDGFIQYDLNKRDVNVESMRRQGKLYAGSMFGEMNYQNMPITQYNALMKNRIDSKSYIAIGKEVANLIHSNISTVLRIFQIQYGQYWIPSLNKWDSKQQSLGDYFNSQLKVTYSLDNGNFWKDFQPTKQVIYINCLVLPEEKYEMYITKEDYKKIKSLVQNDYKPSFAAEILINASKLFNQGNQRLALIEITTALELALNEYISAKVDSSPKLKKSLSSLKSIRLSSQVSTISIGLQNLSKEDIEETLKAIKSRNKVVHEGWVPSNEQEIAKQFNSVVKTIKELISNPDMKLPTLYSGNFLAAP